MKPPLVSIIIPTYNRAHLLDETLDSVLDQTYTNWECIVVDDGSTDGTDSLLAKYCENDNRFKYYHRPKDRPKGANTCRNYGFELSEGEYVNWFDDDDVMLDDFLRLNLQAIKLKQDIVLSAMFYVNEKLEVNKRIHLYDTSELFKDYILGNLEVITGGVFFRKSFLVGKELFSNKITRGQETELFSRLFFGIPLNSYKIINEPLFLYRQHSDSKTSKNKIYIHKYKESQSQIFISNLKRSYELNDKTLIMHCYRFLIGIYFRGIENNHLTNSKKIIKTLIFFFFIKNMILFLKIFVNTLGIFVFNRGSYNLEKNIKNFNINIS